MVLTFGKHRGHDVRDVPREYLEWLLASAHQTVTEVEAELERRDLLEMADASWAEKIIRAGFRALAMQHHPDQGGSAEDMRELLAANEQLKNAFLDTAATATSKGKMPGKAYAA
jgi:hypothetical protein